MAVKLLKCCLACEGSISRASFKVTCPKDLFQTAINDRQWIVNGNTNILTPDQRECLSFLIKYFNSVILGNAEVLSGIITRMINDGHQQLMRTQNDKNTSDFGKFILNAMGYDKFRDRKTRGVWLARNWTLKLVRTAMRNTLYLRTRKPANIEPYLSSIIFSQRAGILIYQCRCLT